jgi:uncharacterized protein
LESVHEGVLASGVARVQLRGECARCLDPISPPLEVELQELYVYPERDAGDDEVSRLDNDLLDLEQVLREAVVLALPFRRCAGRTARVCAWSAESGLPTTRVTAMQRRSTPDGPR